MIFLLLTYLSLFSFNEGEISYKIQNVSIFGQETPKIVINPKQEVKKVDLLLKCEKDFRFTLESIKKGEERSLEIPLEKPGIYKCLMEFDALFFDESLLKGKDEFEIIYLEPLKIYFEKDMFDIDSGYLEIKINRPIKKYTFEIYTKDDGLIRKIEKELNNPEQILRFNWTEKGTFDKFYIMVFDIYNYWSDLTITLTTIYIPHEEVKFDFGSYDIKKDEISKLENSFKTILETLEKIVSPYKIKLYIIGYTDTVGSSEFNLVLSEKRAQAIGLFFKKMGLKIPIYFRGLGETILFKQTPDETPEEENRKVLYILSYQPPVNEMIPPGNWKFLK